MRLKDLAAKDAFNDIVGNLTYWPNKNDKKSPEVEKGETIKTSTGIKHIPNPNNPNIHKNKKKS